MAYIIDPTLKSGDRFDDIISNIDNALNTLESEYGVPVSAKSYLFTACDDIRKEVERNRGADPIVKRPDMFAVLRNTSGVYAMLKRILAAHAANRLTDVFLPHLQLLATSAVSQASTYAENKLGSDRAVKQAPTKYSN